MKILITGGAGFIGSYLTDALFERGHEITIIDSFNSQIHGNDYKKSFLYNKVKDKALIISEDLTNSPSLAKLIAQNEYIVHLAAETGTGQSMYELRNYVNNNSLGTAIILEQLIKSKHSIKKFILASSRAIYGEGKYYCTHHDVVFPPSRSVNDMLAGDFTCKCPICEKEVQHVPTDENSLINPLSIYAVTKANQEHLVKNACQSINLPYSILRFQNVYGKGQSLSNPYTGILAIFSQLLLAKQQLNIFEDGKESRDFIHVKDVATAVINELTSGNKDLLFNIGSGESIAVIDIANLLARTLNIQTDFNISGDFRSGDIRHNVADISKAQQHIAFKPEINIEDGINEFTHWVKEQYSSSNQSSFEESLKEMKQHNQFHSPK